MLEGRYFGDLKICFHLSVILIKNLELQKVDSGNVHDRPTQGDSDDVSFGKVILFFFFF